MFDDLHMPPLCRRLLSAGVLVLRCVGWLCLSLIWGGCLGFLVLYGYARWWLGMVETQPFPQAAFLCGLLGVSMHFLCDLWPFSLCPWAHDRLQKETLE